jgi:serine/threonine protein phosphatase PrpC
LQQDALWNGEAVSQRRDLPTRQRISKSEDRLVVAVADGISNSPMPQNASRLVLEALSTEIADGAIFNVPLIRRIHGRLCDLLAKGRTFGSSTTITAVECKDGRCVALSAGDSRAYKISANGEWQQITRDHTILNTLIDRGEADANTDYASFYGMLDSCLVADDEETNFSVHRADFLFQPGDAILVCTDGVHDTLGEAKLKELTTHPIQPLAQVNIWRKAVLMEGAPDNFSMVLIFCRE